jgi:hypothetical protein
MNHPLIKTIYKTKFDTPYIRFQNLKTKHCCYEKSNL